MELWIILSLIPPLIWSILSFLDKFLITSHIKRQTSFIFYTRLLLLPTLILLILINGFEIIKLKHILISIISGIIYIYCFIFYVKSLEIEETTKVLPLFSLVTIFTFIFDIFLLREEIEFLQIVGIFVVLFGSILITSKNLLSIFKIRKVLFYMLICTFLLASHYASIKYLSNFYDFLLIQTYIIIGSILAILGLFLLKKEREDIIKCYKKFSKKTISLFVLNNFLNICATILLNFIFTIAIVSLVNSIINIQYVFIFILGIILSLIFPKYIKEDLSKKELFRKWFSIIIILSGIYFIV